MTYYRVGLATLTVIEKASLRLTMNQAFSMGVSSEKQGSAGAAAGTGFGCVTSSSGKVSLPDFIVLLTLFFQAILGAHHLSEGPLYLPTWSPIPM